MIDTQAFPYDDELVALKPNFFINPVPTPAGNVHCLVIDLSVIAGFSKS